MKRNKKVFIFYQILGIFTILFAIGLAVLAGYLSVSTPIRVFCIFSVVIVISLVIYRVILVELKLNVFECPYCSALFVPTIFEYVKGIHTFTKRKLKCPKCEKKGMCKRKIKE